MSRRVVFMGTPEIAATVLGSLCDAGVQVVAAVSQPDRPQGRGYKLVPTPVRVCAEAHGIPVLQPESMKDESFRGEMERLAPDLIVVVAYGKLLPGWLLALPRLGCVNVHVSLLPRYRGAAPMQRAIMAGERETGVTLMYMEAGLDTGDIIASEAFAIGDEDNLQTVHDRSAAVGAALLCRTLPLIFAGEAPRTPQDHSRATYAAKITKEDCRLDLKRPASELCAAVRGLSPAPLAYVLLPGGRQLKIVKAKAGEGSGIPGTVLAVDRTADGSVTVATGEGTLILLRVKPEGKGEMSAGDFVRGRGIAPGDLLC